VGGLPSMERESCYKYSLLAALALIYRYSSYRYCVLQLGTLTQGERTSTTVIRFASWLGLSDSIDLRVCFISAFGYHNANCTAVPCRHPLAHLWFPAERQCSVVFACNLKVRSTFVTLLPSKWLIQVFQTVINEWPSWSWRNLTLSSPIPLRLYSLPY